MPMLSNPTLMFQDTVRLAKRETIHDLRNLFGIVASAKHILEREPTRERRRALLEAIEDAAMRGGELTTRLLSDNTVPERTTIVDVRECLEGLAPMAHALADPMVDLDLKIDPGTAMVRMAPTAFEAAILELIANARAAKAGKIVVRSHRIGSWIWILVADDGQGMSSIICDNALHGADHGHAHGTGLCRVRKFVAACHGRFRLRSRPSVGTTTILILPTVLKLAVCEPPARSGHLFPKQMEIRHEENRQSAAA